MDNTAMEVTLVLILVILNGVFSMAEMAVVSSRKARLRQRADEGRRGAAVALELAENPHDFLSTVQIGITLIGTLAGAFGGATIAEELAVYLQQFPSISVYSETIAISIVVLIISYLSLVIGELVPKNLALSNAEAFASVLAPPMRFLAKIGAPAVSILTLSTKLVTKLLPFKPSQEAPVTEDEVKVLIAQGTLHGTFEEAEREMVEGVFRLSDRRVIDLMKPRSCVMWMDAQQPWDVNRRIVKNSEYSRYPVADGKPDQIVGVVHVKDLLAAIDAGSAFDLRQLARRPLFVPEFTPALELLEQFQQSGDEMALIVDEHGGFQGIVTLTDLLDAIVGDLRGPNEAAKPRIAEREDGSWLADGSLPISDLLEELGLRKVPGEEEGFNTVGGLLLAHFNRIPGPGDHVVIEGWRFEVLDMDRNRIDKVLVSRTPRE